MQVRAPGHRGLETEVENDADGAFVLSTTAWTPRMSIDPTKQYAVSAEARWRQAFKLFFSGVPSLERGC